jgi:hypothetical protein
MTASSNTKLFPSAGASKSAFQTDRPQSISIGTTSRAVACGRSWSTVRPLRRPPRPLPAPNRKSWIRNSRPCLRGAGNRWASSGFSALEPSSSPPEAFDERPTISRCTSGGRHSFGGDSCHCDFSTSINHAAVSSRAARFVCSACGGAK